MQFRPECRTMSSHSKERNVCSTVEERPFEGREGESTD